ncbi:MAG: hypothetical protein ACREAA_01655 [Candidatus Polarisedimenticolia bacterium]
MMASHAARAALAAALILVAGVSHAAAQAKLLYTGMQFSGGNGDDWIEPGETAALEIGLFNDGSVTAGSIVGTLIYVGTHPGVTVTTPTATWPNIPPQTGPVYPAGPFFELQLAQALPCGTVLPLRLEISQGGTAPVTFDLRLKAGRRLDHDLIHDPIRRFEEQEATLWGPKADDELGRASAMGDVNGDGYDDLAVSSNWLDPNTLSRPGMVYLIYGRAETWIDRDLALPTPLIVEIEGADHDDKAGWSPQSLAMCDVNNDGFDDLLIGAPAADSVGNARPTAGEAYLIYGRPAMLTGMSLDTPPAGVARWWGAQSIDSFGYSIACGDLNGDGFDDPIVGAPLADSIADSRPSAGEFYIFYGKGPLWGDTDLATPPPGVTRLWGAEGPDEAGFTAVPADLDDDGKEELLVSAHGADGLGNARLNSGELYLIPGQGMPLLDIDLAAPPAGVATLWGPDAGDHMGLGGLAAADFNRDGFEDVAIGIPESESIGNARSNGGEVHVLHGRPAPWGSTDLAFPPPGVVRLWGAKVNDLLGSSLATGDLNGDGYPDLTIGATAGCGVGHAVVVHGQPGPWTDQDFADRSSTTSFHRGPDPCDGTGRALAAGDLNRDGFDDLAIPGFEADSIGNSRPDGGEVHLWYGKPSDTYYLSPPAGATGPYVDIFGLPGAQKLPLGCDDCLVQIPIGFPFRFYAEEFNTLYVSSDGFLSLSAPAAGSLLPEDCMPNGTGANHLIAPYWDDLNPGASSPAGGVFTMVQGAAPYRRLIVEYKDVPHTSNPGTITFEVILHETTGQIHFRYKDIRFGDPTLDNGASAVVGLENRTGAHGVAYSCNDANIMSGTTLVRYLPTTPIFEEHGEQTKALWTPTGHWHNSTNTCEPDQHAGERGWYYGNAHLCSYSNGFAGGLLAPTVVDFPADARLTFWSRLGTQIGVDVAEVQLSTTGTGGPYSTVFSPSDSTMLWRYGGVHNLFNNPTDTVDLQFGFSSDGSVSSLGWMVDDIQLVGCNAIGAPQVVLSVAYVPPLLCRGAAALADAAGSSCGDGSTPVFQWFLDGAAVAGAREETFAIPDTLAPGVHDVAVETTCASGVGAMSAPAPFTIVQPPDPVLSLELDILPTRPAPSLRFQWDPAVGAEEYVVVQDTAPNGAFTMEVGTSAAGETALSVPMPPGDLLYFLVAGRNQACGMGPL